MKASLPTHTLNLEALESAVSTEAVLSALEAAMLNVNLEALSRPSGNYMCDITSFNFKRHNNTYKILKGHTYIFEVL